MAHGVGVRDGLCYAPIGAGLVRSWVNRRECGGKVVEGPCELCTRVPNGDGDVIHPPLVFLKGLNEGGVLLGLLCALLVASEISGKSNLYENEGVLCFVEDG